MKARERKKDLLSLGYSPDAAKARAELIESRSNALLGLPFGCMVPGLVELFSQATGLELDGRRNSWDRELVSTWDLASGGLAS